MILEVSWTAFGHFLLGSHNLMVTVLVWSGPKFAHPSTRLKHDFRFMLGWLKVEGQPLHTRDWEPMTITLQSLSLVEKAEPIRVRFILCSRDQRSMWMQDGCKVYMDPYMASEWTIFQNHLLDVGLTQNREIMALWMFTTVDLFYFITCEDPHE